MALLKPLTEFGDLAVLLPLATVMLIWLLLNCTRADAVWWAIVVTLCIGLTALLKIWFYGCPLVPDLRSPSGHTSLSTLVYGAITLVTAAESRGLRRTLAVGGGAGFVLGIAASRLLLHAHSLAETVLGLAIGTAALTVFGIRYRRDRTAEVWVAPLLAAGGVLMFILHGRELRAEQFLHVIARYFRVHCV